MIQRTTRATMWTASAILTIIGCVGSVSADATSADPRQRGGSMPGSGPDQPRSIQGQPDTVTGIGGPEAIEGTIASIKGDEYTIQGSSGDVRLRVTKDTNMVCAGQEGTKVSTGREGMKERKEIPPTQFMQEQAEGGKAQAPKEAEQQQASAPSQDPSQMKSVTGTTDPEAKEDVARGSGFVVGGEGGCHFKAGDRVRVEASDMGTALLMKQLSEPDGEDAKIAEQPQDEPAR